MGTKFQYQATGVVKDGKLKLRDQQRFLSTFTSWPDGEVLCHFERAHANRSAQANRYYWGAVVNAIAEHTGYTPEETHEALKQMFLPKRCAMLDGNGEIAGELVIGGSTTRLNKVEFGEYVTRCRDFAHERLGLYIPTADEYERAA
jgi:hypothetical protein